MLDPRWRRLARVRLYLQCVLSCGHRCGLPRSLRLGFFTSNVYSRRFRARWSIEGKHGFRPDPFGGTSLWLPCRIRLRRACPLLGSVFCCPQQLSIGATTVIEYIFGLDLRIDRLFFIQDIRAVATYFP